MLRKIISLCTLLLAQLTFSADYNSRFYTLYISGDMVEWAFLIKEAEKEAGKKPDENMLETIVRAKYGLAVFYMGANRDEDALLVIDSALEQLGQMSLQKPGRAWVMALEASFKSFKLIIRPYRFFMSGPSVLRAINKSSSINPNHPDVLFLIANQTFYLPPFLGGNQEEGLRLYDELTQSLLKNPIKSEKNWFHLLYLTSHGIAMGHAQKYEEAIRIYNTILHIEPGYAWVRNELIPQAQKKVDNNYLKNKKEAVEGR